MTSRNLNFCSEHGYGGNCPVCQIAEKDARIKELEDWIESIKSDLRCRCDLSAHSRHDPHCMSYLLDINLKAVNDE